MSEQNANFVQRQRDAELEYDLLLVDALGEAVKQLRSRLTSESLEYRKNAEGFMIADSRKMLRDAEEAVWNLSFAIDNKWHAAGGFNWAE